MIANSVAHCIQKLNCNEDHRTPRSLRFLIQEALLATTSFSTATPPAFLPPFAGPRARDIAGGLAGGVGHLRQGGGRRAEGRPAAARIGHAVLAAAAAQGAHLRRLAPPQVVVCVADVAVVGGREEDAWNGQQPLSMVPLSLSQNLNSVVSESRLGDSVFHRLPEYF